MDKVHYRKFFRDVKNDIKFQIEGNFNVFDGNFIVKPTSTKKLDPEMYELIKSAFCNKFIKKNESSSLAAQILLDKSKISKFAGGKTAKKKLDLAELVKLSKVFEVIPERRMTWLRPKHDKNDDEQNEKDLEKDLEKDSKKGTIKETIKETLKDNLHRLEHSSIKSSLKYTHTNIVKSPSKETLKSLKNPLSNEISKDNLLDINSEKNEKYESSKHNVKIIEKEKSSTRDPWGDIISLNVSENGSRTNQKNQTRQSDRKSSKDSKDSKASKDIKDIINQDSNRELSRGASKKSIYLTERRRSNSLSKESLKFLNKHKEELVEEKEINEENVDDSNENKDNREHIDRKHNKDHVKFTSKESMKSNKSIKSNKGIHFERTVTNNESNKTLKQNSNSEIKIRKESKYNTTKHVIGLFNKIKHYDKLEKHDQNVENDLIEEEEDDIDKKLNAELKKFENNFIGSSINNNDISVDKDDKDDKIANINSKKRKKSPKKSTHIHPHRKPSSLHKVNSVINEQFLQEKIFNHYYESLYNDEVKKLKEPTQDGETIAIGIELMRKNQALKKNINNAKCKVYDYVQVQEKRKQKIEERNDYLRNGRNIFTSQKRINGVNANNGASGINGINKDNSSLDELKTQTSTIRHNKTGTHFRSQSVFSGVKSTKNEEKLDVSVSDDRSERRNSNFMTNNKLIQKSNSSLHKIQFDEDKFARNFAKLNKEGIDLNLVIGLKTKDKIERPEKILINEPGAALSTEKTKIDIEIEAFLNYLYPLKGRNLVAPIEVSSSTEKQYIDEISANLIRMIDSVQQMGDDTSYTYKDILQEKYEYFERLANLLFMDEKEKYNELNKVDKFEKLGKICFSIRQIITNMDERKHKLLQKKKYSKD